MLSSISVTTNTTKFHTFQFLAVMQHVEGILGERSGTDGDVSKLLCASLHKVADLLLVNLEVLHVEAFQLSRRPEPGVKPSGAAVAVHSQDPELVESVKGLGHCHIVVVLNATDLE